MPNEPVQCPNCGSGDVQNLAADSYTCQHCNTNFRWVDPTQSRVVQKPSLCECGRVAVFFCVRCGKGLCQTHSSDAPPSKLSSEQRDYALFWINNNLHSGQYKECMEKNRIPDDREAILCTRCAGECYLALAATEEHLRPAAAQAITKKAPPLPSAPPIIPPTKKTRPESSLFGRLSDWFSGVGK